MRILLVANTGWYLRNFRSRLVGRLNMTWFWWFLSVKVIVSW